MRKEADLELFGREGRSDVRMSRNGSGLLDLREVISSIWCSLGSLGFVGVGQGLHESVPVPSCSAV